MKRIFKGLSHSLFFVLTAITILQINTPTGVIALVTGPATPTPTNAPISSAVTPSPTTAPITSAATPPSTPTPTQSPSNSSSSNSNSGGSSSSGSNSSNNSGGGGSGGSNTCTADKPKIPSIYQSKLTGKNAITLYWTKVNENVTYYMVTYSRKAGIVEYATGNIPSNSNSYTIRGLTGKGPFYFRIRAGNGCRPGDFSYEVVISSAGKILYVNVPKVAKPSVLGKTTQKQVVKPSVKKTTAKPTPTIRKPKNK